MAKLIESYKGYKIKQFTSRDYGQVTAGEYGIFTRDNDIEFDGIETLEQAREMCEGLYLDKQNEKAKKNKPKTMKQILTQKLLRAH